MAKKYNFNIDKNSDFTVDFEFLNDDSTPMDLSHFNVKFILQNCSIKDFTLTKTDNNVTLFIPAKSTKSIKQKTALYNFLFIGPGTKKRILEGEITFRNGANCDN